MITYDYIGHVISKDEKDYKDKGISVRKERCLQLPEIRL